jgi:putative colanic acid biosynthesis acetyltransferase WcaF
MGVNTDNHTSPSFPVSERLSRAVWNLIESTLFRWSPRPFNGWRSFLLRIFVAKVGRGAHVFVTAVPR